MLHQKIKLLYKIDVLRERSYVYASGGKKPDDSSHIYV